MLTEELPAKAPDRWLNADEAALYLNVPLSSLRNYRKEWALPHTKVGRALKFRQSALDDLLKRWEWTPPE